MKKMKNPKENTENSTKKSTQKRTPKQIAALICVFILIGMYLATFLVACLDFPGSDKLFSACLLATIGLPILLWIYIWLYGITKDKHTIASADFLNSDSPAGQPEEPDA